MQRLDQVSTNLRSVCCTKLKACDTWKAFAAGQVQKMLPNLQAPQMALSQAAAPEGVWLAARG